MNLRPDRNHPQKQRQRGKARLLQPLHGTCSLRYENRDEHSSWYVLMSMLFRRWNRPYVSRELARARRKQLLALSPPTLALPSGVVAAGRAASCARLRRAKPVRHANVRALRRPAALLDEMKPQFVPPPPSRPPYTRTRGGMGRPPRLPARPRSRPTRQASAWRRCACHRHGDPPSVARREHASSFLRVSCAEPFRPGSSAAGCPSDAIAAAWRARAVRHANVAALRGLLHCSRETKPQLVPPRAASAVIGRTTAGRWRSARPPAWLDRGQCSKRKRSQERTDGRHGISSRIALCTRQRRRLGRRRSQVGPPLAPGYGGQNPLGMQTSLPCAVHMHCSYEMKPQFVPPPRPPPP